MTAERDRLAALLHSKNACGQSMLRWLYCPSDQEAADRLTDAGVHLHGDTTWRKDVATAARADLAARIVAAVEGLPPTSPHRSHVSRAAVLDAIREASDDRRA